MITFTSLAPNVARVDAQKACLATWRAAGLEPVSLNHPTEAAWVRATYGDEVEVIETEATALGTFGTPYVLISAVAANVARCEQPCLVMNADLTCLAAPRMGASLMDAAERGMPYLLQINRDRGGATRAEPCGISAFAITPAVARLLAVPTWLCLGQPWWDYWVPTVALRAGVKLLTPRVPSLLHEYHPARWNAANWLAGAREFARLCGGKVDDMASASRLSSAAHAAIVAATDRFEVIP